MMKFFFTVIFLINLIWSAALVMAEVVEWPEHEAHVQFDELPLSVEEALLKSVILNEPFSAEQDPVDPGNPEFEQFWRRDNPEWGATIKQVKLSFVNPAADPDNPQPADALLVTLSFLEKAVVVTLDKPRQRKFMGGMKFPLKKDVNWHQIFDGPDNVAIAILVPRFGQDDMTGAVLCPVEYPVKKPGQVAAVALSSSSLKLGKVNFTAFANLRIKFQSGVGVGRAQTWIQTSPNLPRSHPLSDQSVSRDPVVSLEYSPDSSESLPDFVDAQDYMSAGIRVNLDLQNVAGYRRESKLDDVLWVKKIKLQQGFKAKGVGREVDVNPVSCILLAKRQLASHRYSKVESLSEPTIAPSVEPTP